MRPIVIGDIMDLSSRFAEVIVDTEYDNLPEEDREAAKMAILDTLGTMLAGSGFGEGTDRIMQLVEELGGTGECTIIGFGKKSNAVLAAFANGAMAHSIDYDDVHDDAFVHPSASVVPSALTIGEKVHASGKDLITAVTLGDDLICRLGFAVSNPQENSGDLWMLPVLLGNFSSTAAVSKLLKLDKSQTIDALGIAYNKVGGSKQIVIEPGALRGLYAAFPNMTGALCGLMAKSGIPGLQEVFNSGAGFFNMYYGGVFDPSAFDDMGKRFDGSGTSIKPWPCCRFTNSHVDAVLSLARDHDIDPTGVEKILLYYFDPNTKRCIEPLDVRRAPKSIPEAKLSLPFTVAQALAYRKVEIGDFSQEALCDPLLLGLCNRTYSEYDESLQSDLSKTMLPGKVAIHMKDGAFYEKRVDVVYGHPKNRIGWDDLILKFKDCASYSLNKLPDDKINTVVGMIRNLEDVDDVAEIMRLTY